MAKRASVISIAQTPTAPAMSIRNAPHRLETADFRFQKYASKYRCVSNANEFMFTAFMAEESRNTHSKTIHIPRSTLSRSLLFLFLLFISYYFLKQSLHLLILEWIANHKNLTIIIDDKSMEQLVVWNLRIGF